MRRLFENLKVFCNGFFREYSEQLANIRALIPPKIWYFARNPRVDEEVSSARQLLPTRRFERNKPDAASKTCLVSSCCDQKWIHKCSENSLAKLLRSWVKLSSFLLSSRTLRKFSKKFTLQFSLKPSGRVLFSKFIFKSCRKFTSEHHVRVVAKSWSAIPGDGTKSNDWHRSPVWWR